LTNNICVIHIYVVSHVIMPCVHSHAAKYIIFKIFCFIYTDMEERSRLCTKESVQLWFRSWISTMVNVDDGQSKLSLQPLCVMTSFII